VTFISLEHVHHVLAAVSGVTEQPLADRNN
jgi:hypothetical protein